MLNTEQKMKFSIKDFFSKCDQIRRKLRIWSHLLKKFLMENFVYCAVFKAGNWETLLHQQNLSAYCFQISIYESLTNLFPMHPFSKP